MAFEQRDNSGVAWMEKDKKANGPLFSGPCLINGVKYRMAVWKKMKADGEVYLSVSFERWEDRTTARAPKEDDDSIPF